MDWFLYDMDLRNERVKITNFSLLWEFSLALTLVGSQGKQSFLNVLYYPYHVLLDLFFITDI